MNQGEVTGCSEAGCVNPGTVGCSYVDMGGKGCSTHWCPRHVVHHAGLPYCRRHADTLAVVSGPFGTAPLPDVGDRSASLVRWMAAELDGPFHELLARRRDDATEDLVRDDGAGTPDAEGEIGEWQHLWGLRSGDTYPLAITLGCQRDSATVAVRVNGSLVAEGEPPWIRRHRGSATVDSLTDRQQRRQYRDAIVAAVEMALDDHRSAVHPVP